MTSRLVTWPAEADHYTLIAEGGQAVTMAGHALIIRGYEAAMAVAHVARTASLRNPYSAGASHRLPQCVRVHPATTRSAIQIPANMPIYAVHPKQLVMHSGAAWFFHEDECITRVRAALKHNAVRRHMSLLDVGATVSYVPLPDPPEPVRFVPALHELRMLLFTLGVRVPIPESLHIEKRNPMHVPLDSLPFNYIDEMTGTSHRLQATPLTGDYASLWHATHRMDMDGVVYTHEINVVVEVDAHVRDMKMSYVVTDYTLTNVHAAQVQTAGTTAGPDGATRRKRVIKVRR